MLHKALHKLPRRWTETMFRYGEAMDKSPMARQGGGQKSESLLLGGHPNHLVQASLRLDWIPSVTATF